MKRLLIFSIIGLSACSGAIYRQSPDSMMVLSQHEGQLTLEEEQLGDQLSAAQSRVDGELPLAGTVRRKRIAKVIDHVKGKKDKEDHGSTSLKQWQSNSVPKSKKSQSSGIAPVPQEMVSQLPHNIVAQSLSLDPLFEIDAADCFKKYLCEMSKVSPRNLLSEEQALLFMMANQQQEAQLRDVLTTTRGRRRLRRSQEDLMEAQEDLMEAQEVARVCGEIYPKCTTSRIDILKVYKQQKDEFCRIPLPYGL